MEVHIKILCNFYFSFQIQTIPLTFLNAAVNCACIFDKLISSLFIYGL